MVNRLDRHSQEVVVKRGGKKHEHEEHGGAWKVAFADFCLALMCLFLVMWVLAMRDSETAQQSNGTEEGSSMLRTAYGTHVSGEDSPAASLIPRESGPAGRAAALASLDSAEDLERLARQMRAMGEAVGLRENIETLVTPQGLRVLVHDTENEGMFEVGSVQPKPKFAALLRQVGPLFRSIDNQVLIIGHTDARPFAGRHASGASNWSLSSARALAVQSRLVAGGMPERSVLQVLGMADSALMNTSDPHAAVNRRVEMLVMTAAHARQVAATFGALGRSQPLAEGVVSSPADTPALKSLRATLLSQESRGSAP